MRSSPPVTPGQGHEAPDLDVVRRDVVFAAAEPLDPVDRDQVRADPLYVGAHLDEHPGEVLHVGLARRVADHRRARRQRGCHQCVLGRHHRRLIHEHIRRAQTQRRAEDDVAPAVDAGAHRAERIEVRVKSPATDHVTARRWHHGAVEAGQQRAREKERCPDQLGELRGHLDRVHVRGAQRHLVGASPGDLDADRRENLEHRLDVPDPRDVAHDDLILGEEAGGEDGKRPVLVPGRSEGAGKRDAAFDDELLHELSTPPAAAAGPVRLTL